MLDGNSGDSDKPGIEEQYLTTVGSSNLRVGNDSNIRTPGDMIAAAGMNKHRTGLAIQRMRTEWDQASKPIPMAPAQIEQLAAKLEKEVGGEHAGLVRCEEDGAVTYRLPLAVAADQAEAWHQQEMLELLRGLKTLPSVRDSLVHWLGLDDGVHIVAAVLLWWLDPKCVTCGGVGVRVVQGSGGRTSGKPCGQCKGRSMVAGERKLPHGGMGRRVLSRINDCLRNAKVDLGEGAFREIRSGKSERLRS